MFSSVSPSRTALLAALAVAACEVWGPTSAAAQDASRPTSTPLANNDGIFIDGQAFRFLRGSAAGETAARIKDLNARDLGPAAIVFRSGDKLYVAAVPLPLRTDENGTDIYVTADEDAPGPIHVDYVPPRNPAHQKIYEMIKERHTLEMVQKIFSPFRLPVDLVIKTVGCDGVSNAWYQREGKQPTVSVCYEYLQEIWQTMPKAENATLPPGIDMADTVSGQLFFALAHELGHAMFDIFDVPVFGRQEDAADQFATFLMLQFSGERAYRLIVGAAYGYHEYIKDFKDKPRVTVPLAAFSSDHGTPEERFFNLLCMAYGSDPKVFAPVMDKLPDSRAKKCKFEYQDITFAFRQVFSPHIDYQMIRKVLAETMFKDLVVAP
jgi:hypothetical protein